MAQYRLTLAKNKRLGARSKSALRGSSGFAKLIQRSRAALKMPNKKGNRGIKLWAKDNLRNAIHVSKKRRDARRAFRKAHR